MRVVIGLKITKTYILTAKLQIKLSATSFLKYKVVFLQMNLNIRIVQLQNCRLLFLKRNLHFNKKQLILIQRKQVGFL